MRLDAPNLRGLGLSGQAIDMVISADPKTVLVVDPRTGFGVRPRYIVADELTVMASEAAKRGRPDRCGLLNALVASIRVGKPISKRMSQKASREIAECSERLMRRLPRAEIDWRSTRR